jgi:hypothetical protein
MLVQRPQTVDQRPVERVGRAHRRIIARSGWPERVDSSPVTHRTESFALDVIRADA